MSKYSQAAIAFFATFILGAIAMHGLGLNAHAFVLAPLALAGGAAGFVLVKSKD